jgi:nitrite reductase/ring-hydroxylating ferredoxin subunit
MTAAIDNQVEAARPGIPDGWFAVGFSDDVAIGNVKRVRYFGQDLVLFRARSGRARLLSAYCAHLGAHLGEGGRVSGESIRCPFHAWQYDGESGKCSHIPYCDRIPPKARVRAWDVVERNGMIFAWHHGSQEPPQWEVPEIPQLVDPDWSTPRKFEMEVPVHMQDMAENNLDPVHFQVVHAMLKTPDTDIEYSADGRFMHAVSFIEQETAYGKINMELLRDSWGLGMSSVESKGIPGTGLYMFSSTSPIDDNKTVTRWVMTCTNNMVDLAGEEWFHSMTKGLDADLRIWKHKIHRAEPVLCEADKLLGEFRRWAKQFYSSAA